MANTVLDRISIPIGFIVFFCTIFRSDTALATNKPITPEPIQQIELQADRNFGYVIGDLVHHRIFVSIENPYRLDLAILPTPGALNPGLSVHTIQISENQLTTATKYLIDLKYQLYRSVERSEEIIIPGFRIRATKKTQWAEAQTPPWKLTMMPLISEQSADQDVVIRPPRKPLLIPLQVHYRILIGLVIGVFILSALIARIFYLPGFLNSTKRPFAATCGNLKRLRKRRTDTAAMSDAMRVVHQAFNHTAGETVFASQLDQFFQKNPEFCTLRKQTELFFQLSRQTFFQQAKTINSENYGIPWLQSLCQQYRKIERTLS